MPTRATATYQHLGWPCRMQNCEHYDYPVNTALLNLVSFCFPRMGQNLFREIIVGWLTNTFSISVEMGFITCWRKFTACCSPELFHSPSHSSLFFRSHSIAVLLVFYVHFTSCSKQYWYEDSHIFLSFLLASVTFSFVRIKILTFSDLPICVHPLKKKVTFTPM
jgi:hypothetical protein